MNKLTSTDFMNFELTMRLFFGDKAYHIQDFASNDKEVKVWLKKACKKIKQDVNALDTNLKHKDILFHELNRIEGSLKRKENFQEITYLLLKIVGRLLGYDYDSGSKLVTPVYWQTRGQKFWADLYRGEEQSEIRENKEALMAKRVNLIKQLKKEGYSDFDVSIILDTTEYQVKKALKEMD